MASTDRNERGPFWTPIGGPVPMPIDSLTAKSRRNRERRPVSQHDGEAEPRLQDIDTAKLPSDLVESGSAWDEP